MSGLRFPRRAFLKGGLAVPAVGTGLTAAVSTLHASPASRLPSGIYRRLGVPSMINAVGTLTTLSGTLMPSQVLEAMVEAAGDFVSIHTLQERVGRRLADRTGAEAGFVTAGASAALCLATCAVTAGDDRAKMRQLPDMTGLKSEIVFPKAHRQSYDHAFRMVGVRLVEVETAEEMRRAINEKTAAVGYVISHHTLTDWDDLEYVVDTSLGIEDRYVVGPYGKVDLEETLRIAHEAGLPVILDAAAELPPAENLSRFVKMGVDLVAFSGGKNLRGPQCSGLLLGKEELVRKAYANASPNNFFARNAKVGKEEIVGLLTAVELYLEKDHAAERRRWYEVLDRLADRLRARRRDLHTELIPNNDFSHTPRLSVQWDEQGTGVSLEEMVERLRAGDPAIVASDMRRFNPPWKGLGLFPYNLLPGEEIVIADRILEILQGRA